jgi:hypothetical protein
MFIASLKLLYQHDKRLSRKMKLFKKIAANSYTATRTDNGGAILC